MTPDELAAVMAGRGKPVSVATIRYHCRDPRGQMYGRARRVGRSWDIPAAEADEFAASWEPYGSLRKPQAA